MVVPSSIVGGRWASNNGLSKKAKQTNGLALEAMAVREGLSLA
jgi:hypothetical protein